MTTPVTIESKGSDFAQLTRKIQDAGLLERRPVYYALRGTLLGLAFFGGWGLFLWVGNSWLQLLVAAFLAIVFAQAGLYAHDLAHRQIFKKRPASDVVGRLVGNLGIGLGYGWWNDKHTRHHANPNHEEHDPDVSPAVLVWSDNQASKAKGLPLFMARWQAYLFFPLLTLEGWHLHVASVKSVLKPGVVKRRGLEAALLAAHFVIYFGIIFATLPFGMAIVFLLVHQGLFGIYLGCTFAPNHKGMPVLSGDDKLDFLRKQVLTSRNVRGGWFINTALGGLNFQIEHHLFPNMPTPNLRLAQPIVREHCEKLGVDYLESGLISSYSQAIKHLYSVGEALRVKA